MDAPTRVKECEKSLSLIRLQGKFPKDAPPTSTTKDDKSEQEHAELSAFIPDPTVIIPPSPEQQNASIGPPESGRA